MDLSSIRKNSKLSACHLRSLAFRCFALVVIAVLYTALFFPSLSGYGWSWWNNVDIVERLSTSSNFENRIRRDRFLEVPQIVWGLNNQKIAFARACLTARMLNRTLLMPSLSASLFYKELDKLQPIAFNKVFQFERFNSLCDGFVQLGRYSDLKNQSEVIDLQKGSGRKWTFERDIEQLRQATEGPMDEYEIIRVVGKNPFLWPDHWPVKDYARIFDCMVVVDEITREADRVISRIKETEIKARNKFKSTRNNSDKSDGSLRPPVYVAIHMRIEVDWMIHCKKLEHRLNINQICSSKKEIMERVANIHGLKTPSIVYLAVADSLLEDSTILEGWKSGLHSFEKSKLGVEGIYANHSYLVKSAIDYEVCLRADVFVGNSFSTFSSLIVLERTQKLLRMGIRSSCNVNAGRSYAYNVAGESYGPKRWMTNMSDTSLKAISYGSNEISCNSF